MDCLLRGAGREIVNVYSRRRKYFIGSSNSINTFQLEEAGPCIPSTPEAGVTVSADTRAACGR